MCLLYHLQSFSFLFIYHIIIFKVPLRDEVVWTCLSCVLFLNIYLFNKFLSLTFQGKLSVLEDDNKNVSSRLLSLDARVTSKMAALQTDLSQQERI